MPCASSVGCIPRPAVWGPLSRLVPGVGWLADLGYNATVAGRVVTPDWRLKNIGSQLLTAAEALARSWSCTRIELTSSRTRGAAYHFYPGRDYEETSERQARYVRPLTDTQADAR